MTRKRKTAAKAPKHSAADALAQHPMMRHMEEHLKWMLITGYSPATVEGRRFVIRRFIAWCDERGIAEPCEVTRPILQRFQASLYQHRKTDGMPLTPAVQFSYLTPLKTFFKWLARENLILYNPAYELELPKLPKSLPRTILSITEVETILAAAGPDTAPGLRDRALLETLYSAGVRRAELAKLTLSDVHLTRRIVSVREGKGRRDRVVPIGERAVAWINQYLQQARPQLITDGGAALFVTDGGCRMTPEYVTGRVKRCMEAAGIERLGSAHLLRHACATHMLEGGADIRYIQAMLGHASLESTAIYTHVSIDKLREVHTKAHPARLERLQHDKVEPATLALDEARQALLDALDDD